MATIDNYKIKITVDGTDKVKQLEIDAENAEKAFNDLGNTIDKVGKIVTGSFALIAASAFRMADGLMDVADATGISVGTIGALAESIEAAGGKFDDVGKLVNTFYKNLEEGADNQGSKAAESLRKLGIGLTELQTLSEQELLTKAIDELAKMEQGAARTALGVQIFGKAFATIDPARLQEIFATKDIDAFNKELTAAADFIGAMEANFRTLQKAALSALTPLTGEIKDFRLTAEQANTIIKTLGGLILTIYGAKTIAGIANFIKLMKDLNVVLKAQAILQATVAALSGPAGWARAAGAVALTAGAVYGLNKLLEDNAEQLEQINDQAEKTKGAFEDATGFSEEQLKKREQEVAAARESTRQMRLKNEEANKYQRIINGTISLSQDEANLIRTMADLERQAGNEKQRIEAQINAELAKGSDANKALVAELQKQLTEVDKQLIVQKQLKREEQDRLLLNEKILDTIKKSFELADIAGISIAAATEKEIRNKVIAGELTEKQAQRQLDLEKIKQQGADRAIRLQEQLEIATAKQDTRAMQAAQDAIKVNEIATAQAIINAQERYAIEDQLMQSYKAGSIAALQTIADGFKPYKMAQDAIMMTWSKIGSAVDEFVQTGKFKFSDFAKSVLRDLAAMIIKAQIFKAIQATLGFFGLSIPKLASGGPAKAGQPYIVGEKGPELFVPKNAGNVIPNNQLGAKTQGVATGAVNAPVTNNYITNNISAIDAKGVAQLFAENRKTLLGSVKMAEREMPYMAR